MHQRVRIDDDVDEELERLHVEKGIADQQLAELNKQVLGGMMSPSVVSLLNTLDANRLRLVEQIESAMTAKAARSRSGPEVCWA